MFNVNDKVILINDVAPAKSGYQGYVVSIDSNGNLTVRVTYDENCNSKSFQLSPAAPQNFSRGSNCP